MKASAFTFTLLFSLLFFVVWLTYDALHDAPGKYSLNGQGQLSDSLLK